VGNVLTTEVSRKVSSVAWPSKFFYPAVSSTILIFVAIWLLIPWAWSPVDDPGQVIAMQREIADFGRVSGTFNRFTQFYQGDQAGGVFRPAAWTFAPLLYQLPVVLAHLVRLLMVFAVILGPVIYFRRAGASSSRLWLTLFIIIAGASTLYQGLFLLSIQELGGAACVGLGLMARRIPARMALWLAAALFKAPFAWLLLGYSAYLWKQKRRLEASISGGLGIGILGISALWSRNGSYSGSYNPDPFNLAIYENFSRLVEPMNALLLVGLIWWLVVTNSSVKRHPDWILFFVAWVGYTLQMIPWGVTAYYMGPISYLFAIFLASVLVNVENASTRQIAVGLLMPIFVAFWLTRITLNLGFEINSVMLESKKCLAPLSGSSTVINGSLLYVTSSPEGPIRIKDQIVLEDPSWTGDINREDPTLNGFMDPSTTHYLTIRDVQIPEGRDSTEVCSGSAIILSELGPVATS